MTTDDTVLPISVTISSREDGLTITKNSRQKIIATAEDDIRVSKIDFYINQRLVSTGKNSPFEYNFRSNRTGTHTLFVGAYGPSGNHNDSQSFIIDIE